MAGQRPLPAVATTLVSWLSGLGGAVTVAMVATLYWVWLHDQLTEAGIAAVASHPYQVKLIWQARPKADQIDARELAVLQPMSLLSVVWVPSHQFRARRKPLQTWPGIGPVRWRCCWRIRGRSIVSGPAIGGVCWKDGTTSSGSASTTT